MGDEVQQLRRHSASMAASRLPGGVLRVVLRGPLTDQAWRDFAQSAAATPADIGAFVLDLRGAILALDLGPMSELAVRAPAGSGIRLPGAFIATQETVDQLRSHAIKLAYSGVVRRVFLDHDRAVAWATDEALRPSTFS